MLSIYIPSHPNPYTNTITYTVGMHIHIHKHSPPPLYVVYVLYVGMVVLAYWRDLRTKTVQHFIHTHPHLAHIINANPTITVEDIEALHAQHEAGKLTVDCG
ncbi:hypothetical protein EON63_07650 [archaeon]|nr:MAG: hypothetical protein EON63_07650 [archaeon]